MNKSRKDCSNYQHKFQRQWQSIFDNNIAFSTLTFNIKQTEESQAKSKRQIDLEPTNQTPEISAMQQKSNAESIGTVNTEVDAVLGSIGLNSVNSPYFEILQGYKPVTPKSTTTITEPSPNIHYAYSCQPAKSIKVFNVNLSANQNKQCLYSSENTLSKKAGISSPYNVAAGNYDKFQKKKRSSNTVPKSKKTKLNDQSSNSTLDSTTISQFSSDVHTYRSAISKTGSNEAEKRKRISGESSTNVGNSRNEPCEPYTTNTEKFIDFTTNDPKKSTTDGTVKNLNTASSNDIAIKIEETSDDSEDDNYDPSNVPLQASQEMSFKQHYSLRVTLQLLVKFPGLMINTTICDNIKILIIYPKVPLFSAGNNGITPFMDYIRLIVKSDEMYNFQVFHKDIQTGRFDRKTIKRVFEMMTCDNYVLCKGLPSIETYQSVIDQEDSQKLRKWVCPERIDTKGCLLWYRSKQRKCNDNELFHVCRVCRELLYTLRKKMQGQDK